MASYCSKCGRKRSSKAATHPCCTRCRALRPRHNDPLAVCDKDWCVWYGKLHVVDRHATREDYVIHPEEKRGRIGAAFS